MSNIKIVKRKAKGFFKEADVQTIKTAVKEVHHIISNASILVRAYYLQWFQKNHPISNETNCLKVDTDLVTAACNVVQGCKIPSTRSSKKKDASTLNDFKNAKTAMYNKLNQVYTDLYDQIENLSSFKSSLSLSFIINYSIENLLTAYENNIHCHFQKYPKRYILCDIMNKQIASNIQPKSKEIRKLAAIITNHYLYNGEIKEDVDFGIVKKENYEFLFPKKINKDGYPRCYDLKVNPWVYLYKMVEINLALELEFPNIKPKFKKLFNPLPFHSSFVPMHIRLDTSGMSQLLMNGEKIKVFKDLYSLEHNVDLQIKSKADMLSSFQKIFGRPPISKEETGIYATDVWDHLTNLKTCKHWNVMNKNIRKNDPKNIEWVFDNAVVTDGISVSFQIIDRKYFGRKLRANKSEEEDKCNDEPKIQKKNPKIKDKKERNPKHKGKDEQERLDLSKYKLLGCDPGKHDLVAITDGFTTIRYTKGQRQQDTLLLTRQKKTLKRKEKFDLGTYECQILNKYTKKSSCYDTFKRYSMLRKEKETVFTTCYSHPMFQQFKFTTYCKTKSSEHKFMNHVFKTFSSQPKQMQKKNGCFTDAMKANISKQITSTKEIVIGWGNWGKNPNVLKGLAPSPGIGLRRSFEGLFKTITVDEHLTSQTCPCCHGDRCLARTKIANKNNENIERHHLLRCAAAAA